MNLKSGSKYFSDLLIWLIFISLTLTLQPAISKDLSYLSVLHNNGKKQKLSIGMDGIYIFTNNKRQYEDIFRKTRPGANVYLGFHIEDVMLEIGYLFTSRRSKQIEVLAPRTFLGVPTLVNTRFKGKLRFKYTHIDLNFFSKLTNDFRFITGIGVGFLRTSIKLNTTDFNDNHVNYNGNIIGKTSFVPRIGIGIAINIADNILFRSMFHVEQHSRVRLKLAPNPNEYKPFNNAYTALAGFVFRF